MGAQYRPDLMYLPTANGEHCTGDGIKKCEASEAKSMQTKSLSIVLGANEQRLPNEIGRWRNVEQQAASPVVPAQDSLGRDHPAL